MSTSSSDSSGSSAATRKGEKDAATYLERYGNTPAGEGESLAKAIGDGAAEEAFALIISGEPVPSAMMDARALRLRRICKQAGRLLSNFEIQTIFRVEKATASAIARRMESVYPELAEELRLACLKRDCSRIAVRVEPPDEPGEIKIMLSSEIATGAASVLLDRARELGAATINHRQQTVTFSDLRSAGDIKAARKTVGTVLGLKDEIDQAFMEAEAAADKASPKKK